MDKSQSMRNNIAKNQHPFYLNNRMRIMYSNKKGIEMFQSKNHKDLYIFEQNSELLDVSAMSVVRQS